MAWSRFIGADVYTFPSERNGVDVLECCACSLIGDLGSFYTPNLDNFLTHLDHHREAGHHVPDYLADLIREEAPDYLPGGCYSSKTSNAPTSEDGPSANDSGVIQ